MCAMCLAVVNTYAQSNKIAVLNFKASVGISQHDVDGISSIFITYFSPQGWTLVERTQIDKVISEQGYQKSSMTEAQMVRVGRILNLQKIVIGDVNIISGCYNLDVRVVDVETGAISAKDGATWSETSYRSLMQTVATRLASKIAIQPRPVAKPVVAPSSSSEDVITIYGYLKIHPKNLGVFTSEPTTVISNLNKNGECGYDTWRIPTQEEWELISSNASSISGISKDLPYMTSSNRSDGKEKVVRLVTTDTKTIKDKELERIESARQEELRRQEEERKIEQAKQEVEMRRREREAEAERQRQAREAEAARQAEAARREAENKIKSVKIQGPFTDARTLYEYSAPSGYRIATKEEIMEIINAYQLLGRDVSLPVYTDISRYRKTNTQSYSVIVTNKNTGRHIRTDDKSRVYYSNEVSCTCVYGLNSSTSKTGTYVHDTYDFMELYGKYNTVGENWRHRTSSLTDKTVNTSFGSGFIYLIMR